MEVQDVVWVVWCLNVEVAESGQQLFDRHDGDVGDVGGVLYCSGISLRSSVERSLLYNKSKVDIFPDE